MNRRITWILFLFCISPTASLAADECWVGTREVIDGVTYVRNAEASNCPPKVYEMVPRWTLASDEAGDFVFGAIVDVVMHPSGVLCLLDQQLCTVHMVSPQGAYLGSLGREGEGPFDFSFPNALFAREDGVLGIADVTANRVVFMNLNGEGVGQWTPKTPGYSYPHILDIAPLGDGFIAVVELHRLVDGLIDDIVLLGFYDQKGELQLEISRNVTRRDNHRVMRYDEQQADAKLLLGTSDGSVAFIAQDFAKYSFARCGQSGAVNLVVERNLDPWRRDKKTLDELRAYWQQFYSRYDDAVIELSAFARTVHGVTDWGDGTLWVETSRTWYGNRFGEQLSFDVYDQEGCFLRTAVVEGDVNRTDDMVFLLPGIAIVIKAGTLLDDAAVGAGQRIPQVDVAFADLPCIVLAELSPRE